MILLLDLGYDPILHEEALREQQDGDRHHHQRLGRKEKGLAVLDAEGDHLRSGDTSRYKPERRVSFPI